jgi:hypothetical protein
VVKAPEIIRFEHFGVGLVSATPNSVYKSCADCQGEKAASAKGHPTQKRLNDSLIHGEFRPAMRVHN